MLLLGMTALDTSHVCFAYGNVDTVFDVLRWYYFCIGICYDFFWWQATCTWPKAERENQECSAKALHVRYVWRGHDDRRGSRGYTVDAYTTDVKTGNRYG